MNIYSRDNVKARPGPADYDTRGKIGQDTNAYTFGLPEQDPLKVKVGYHPGAHKLG